MSPEEADLYLEQLRAKIDLHFASAFERQPEAYACAEGCSRCCHHRFGVFEVEARRIRRALERIERISPELRERIRRQGSATTPDQACALLVDQRCSVYEDRPLLCRTHGLPAPRPEGGFDACPLNFTSTAPHPKSLLHPNRLTEALAMVAELSDASERVELAQLAAAQKSGNS